LCSEILEKSVIRLLPPLTVGRRHGVGGREGIRKAKKDPQEMAGLEKE
jgi:hypothetical protein